MTDLPEMTPSAGHRARSWLGLREHRGYDADNIHCASAIAEAFRDGAEAGDKRTIERIVAMLREPSADLAANLGEDMATMAIRAAPELAARAILSALADRIAVASSQDTKLTGE